MGQSVYKSSLLRLCEQCGIRLTLHLVSITPTIYKGKCESCGQRMTAQDGPKIIGYLGAGAPEPDLEEKIAEILAFANDRKLGTVELLAETAVGVKTWKKSELGKKVEVLNEGDWVIVPELSRLGRNTLDILDCLATLKKKAVNVHATKGTSTWYNGVEAEVFLAMVSLFTEIERELMSARTKKALKARLEAGVKLGRPKGPGRSKLDQYRAEIEALLKTGSTLKYIARRFGSSEANLINWLSKNNIDRTPEYGNQ